MKIFATGFVAAESGSIASANAVLLRGLLKRGHSVRFFTKPSFVDPRKIEMSADESDKLNVVDCTNGFADALRRVTGRIPVLSRATGWLDADSYNRGLVKSMVREYCANAVPDVTLWMGDHARGRVAGVPTISSIQGPPGTDARSVVRHRRLITRLAGVGFYTKLVWYAKWRLNFGLPNFEISDHLIVGSEWSRSEMIARYGRPGNQVHALPYPIDLKKFQPAGPPREKSGRLRLLWLGRFAPRKRLDVFLEGLSCAIRGGCDAEALIIGKSAFVPNYERLIGEFPYPERVKHLTAVPRDTVPQILSDIDALAQPSDDEDFGSSVAEAMACGVPSIVGRTNGTGGYVCSRSIILPDDSPESMAKAIVEMDRLKKEGELQNRNVSRSVAERNFHPDVIVEKLIKILNVAADRA